MYYVECKKENTFSPLQVKNKPHDRESEHVFILDSRDCTVANNNKKMTSVEEGPQLGTLFTFFNVIIYAVIILVHIFESYYFNIKSFWDGLIFVIISCYNC